MKRRQAELVRAGTRFLCLYSHCCILFVYSHMGCGVGGGGGGVDEAAAGRAGARSHPGFTCKFVFYFICILYEAAAGRAGAHVLL